MASFLSNQFHWNFSPKSWKFDGEDNGEVEGSGGDADIADYGATLIIKPPAFKDFWSKTFYTPLLIKADASAYLCQIPSPSEEESTVKVDFSYSPITQFDQAGLLLFIDDEHWIKCGLEYCDG
jgi:regulation of enolase protein 1 (concanavalin A-like superfamily)